MYVQKRLRRKISAAMAVVMVLGNSVSVAAAPAAEGAAAASGTMVETDKYRAELDLEKGALALSYTSDKTKDWNTADGITPGATMLMDSANQVREADMTVAEAFDNGNGSAGAAGIRMSGEVSGVKSWFFYDEGVFCLGAGLKTTGADQIINVVENVADDTYVYASIVSPTNTAGWVYDQTGAWEGASGKWLKAVDNPTLQNHTTRDWLGIGYDSTKKFEWHYIFGDTLKNSEVYCRFPTGDDGYASNIELWTKPVNGAYEYTLAAGGVKADLPGSGAVGSQNKVLKNTQNTQAVENLLEEFMAVNKWTAGSEDVAGSVARLSLDQPVSVFIQKSEGGDQATVILSPLTTDSSSVIHVDADLRATAVGSISDPGAVTAQMENGKVSFAIDAAKMSGPVTVQVDVEEPEYVTGDSITMVKGDVINIKRPEGMTGDVTWSPKIMKPDGTYLRNVGYSKIKRELKDDDGKGKPEKDGTRTAGDTLADHLVYVKTLANGNATLTAKEMGNLVMVATDAEGKEKVYPTKILFEDPDNLPEVTDEDYAKIRQAWKESLVGTDVASAEGGAEILETIDQEAKDAWDAYEYKGQDSCPDVPWPGDLGKAGNADVEYKDDAVEFRPAFKKVLAMAKAYSTEGSQYYQNKDMLQDMIHSLDYLCTVCYTPKSQTDNWWTWEIGIPKDLIPALILLYDDLSEEQIMKYTEALYFFQPEPYHGGAIGTGSTHGQGYRKQAGANVIDCSTTAVGLGALRKDNEQVYMGMLASSGTFVIQEVEDSSTLHETGYASGFYPDGSYLDHICVPYIGSYGIEFMKGGVKIPSLIGGTPWQYPDEVRQNLEYYILEGFGNSVYRGMMLDSLKGRSVARPAYSNRDSGRDAMTIILQLVDSLSPEAKETVLSAVKYWMEEDPEYLDSLKGVENMAVKRKAQEILEDDSIEGYVPTMHRSFPLMDRAVHRRDDYLFALSMYSERIQNTEIMNGENLFGWHQGNGMTYLYDGDDQYTENYWNTVNPFRLAGTTVVPMDIGNGVPDSSDFLQEGDYLSTESWVGGSAIGEYGISGMSFSGAIGTKGRSADTVAYAPNLRGKKSWFMFDDEIVCLGTGITNKGMDIPIETTVENKKLREDGSNELTINGETVEVKAVDTELTDYVAGTADVKGTPVENVVWAHLEGNETEGTGYYFPYENTELNIRKARTTGNWSDIGTFEGESTENYMEMWFDHGATPSDASYGYVLLPGMTADETADYAENPKVAVLMNNSKAQAVYHEELGITGINFWEDEETTVGDVTSDKKASVMIKEEENGQLTVAVSDPTMKNKGTIRVTLHRPIASEVELDDNVSCEILEDGSAELTFQMEGTNGASSTARLQIPASIYPASATMRPGESRIFEVRDYAGNAGEITWSVTGSETLAAGTMIDSEGVLSVDQEEKNQALTVTAKTESGLTLNASVSLGGDVVTTELPEDMKKLELKIEFAEEVIADLGADSPEAEDAVRNAILAAESADSDRLVNYLMDSLMKLADLYMMVRETGEAPVAERLEVNGESVEKLDPKAQGMVLNISPDYKEAPSTAVLVISGDSETDDTVATPTNALKKNGGLLRAAGFTTIKKTTTSSADSKSTTKIDGKAVDEERACKLRLQLFWEKEDEDRSALNQKIPYMVTINIPENLDLDEQILAAVIDGQGQPYPLQFKVDKEEGTLTFFPTRTGTVVLANEAAKEPEKPDPEEPDKPDPEDPDKPDPEEPEKPDPEEPEKPDPEPEKPSYTRKRRYGGSSNTKSTSGWTQVNGQWRYQLPNGTYAANCWQFINGQWYSFDGDGYMRTGWYFENQDNFWYYLKADGAMATGWIQVEGKWYYLNTSPTTATGWIQKDGVWEFQAQENSGKPSGAMYRSETTPDGYTVDEQGSWTE